MRVCVILGMAALIPAAAFSQPAESTLKSDVSTPKFDVSDVHNSPRTSQPFVRGPFFSNGRYELRFATMVDMVAMAYGVEPEKVAGGPNWVEMDRFDVFAIAGPSTVESRRHMLQALLVDRFGLKAHTDTKPMPAFALTAGKHAQLKEASGDGESACNFTVQNAPSGPPAPGTSIPIPTIVYTCRNMKMAAFAASLPSLAAAGQFFGSTPVVDRTELQGAWDFSFRYTPKLPAAFQVTGEAIPLSDAIEKQLGLKLEMATAPMAVVAIESVNRKPTPNSSEALKAFPPLPTEFEVAELKPSAPAPAGGREGGGRRPEIKNGRLYLPGFTLKNMIQLAWDLNGDDLMVGVPKWIDDERFDLIAKAPAGVALGDLTPSRSAIPVNIDALRPMIRTLITDSFKLVTHTEERPVNTYVLSATKPKLKKADPASRTKWSEGAAPDANNSKNADASLGRLVTCQNVTMAEFASLLPGIAPGYIHTEVVDATGLEGGWDFTFSFSPAGALQASSGGGAQGGASSSEAAGAPSASDPNRAVSLFDALTRELGLKLEVKKRPMPVLVIDKVERKLVE